MDKHIQLQHNNMTAYWTSGTQIVSDLYVYKQYKAALNRIEELENMLSEPIVFDEMEREIFLQGVR